MEAQIEDIKLKNFSNSKVIALVGMRKQRKTSHSHETLA